MSTTTTTTRPASSDPGFFSQSRTSNPVTSRTPSVVVRTCQVPPASLSPTQRLQYRTNNIFPPTSSRAPSVSSRDSSPLSSPSPRKRKSTPPSSDAPLPREVKRLRASGSNSGERSRKRTPGSSSRRVSRAASPEYAYSPPPEPIYRGSRSRSTSQFPVIDDDVPLEKRIWIHPDGGDPGDDFNSSEEVVKRLMKSYKAYFRNPADPKDTQFQPHETNYPVTELEYPNSGASERYILLAPRDKDHYNPIMDLMQSLYTIVEYYLTPEQASLLGQLPNETEPDVTTPPASPSPSPSPPPSESEHTSSTENTSLVATPHISSTYLPLPLDDTTSFMASLASLRARLGEDRPSQVSLLRALQRAWNTQDGPLFLRAMEQINRIIRGFKYPELPDDLYSSPRPNSLKEIVKTWETRGLPRKVLMRIMEENYQRNVGPHVSKLKQYEAFTSTVYGELMPTLTYEMVQITKLKQGSLFLDLGSGVGNVCVQASLQTGCKSFGVEIQTAAAQVASDMKKQLEIRCRMWGVRVGEVELEEENMLKSKRVDELIPQADVVLVDNKVFEESLNEALRPKFLDLKEGAIVISLKPFVSSINARITERNVDDMSGIFDVSEHPYHSGSVSWGNNGGVYYIHRVNRTGYADVIKRFEASRSNSGRTSRRR